MSAPAVTVAAVGRAQEHNEQFTLNYYAPAIASANENDGFFLTGRPARDWWHSESARIGSDWDAIIAMAVEIVSTTMIETDFERVCRLAEAGHRPSAPAKRRPKPTLQVTVDAVLYRLTQRGLKALQEPDTIERLSRCDQAALAQIDAKIAELKGGANDSRA